MNLNDILEKRINLLSIVIQNKITIFQTKS